MIIAIDVGSSTPIYTQLMYQLKKGIVKGELKQGESLPSVRALAGDIGVNMHTVNKAYNLLAEEGILQKNQKGFFVHAPESESPDTQIQQQLKEKLEEILIDASIHQIRAETLTQWTADILKELKGEKDSHVDL